MNKDIVLINPPAAKRIEEYDAPPYGHLGLAYLASAARNAGFECSVIDAKLSRLDSDGVVESIARLNPKVVGISSHTHEIYAASRLAEDIKARSPGARIVIGGIHASALPVDTLESFGCYDFLLKGEGEYAFTELCGHIVRKNQGRPSIPGVAYKDGGKVIFNPPAAWIRDLDRISFPAWDLFPPLKIFPVISSRGCPYKCVFCARMLGEEVRTRSPENVIEELRFINNRFGAKKIYFYDETFGYKRSWLLRFLELMTASGLSRRLEWGITTRAQLINTEITRSLKSAGCRKIDFGVESGDENILKAIKKGESKEDFIRAAGIVKKAGMRSHSYFILGHPYETKETALNTINFAAELNTDLISIGIMVPYPGTEVARLASTGEAGYKKISNDWSDYNKQLANALELESISRSELTRLQLLGYLKFYIRNLKVISFIAALWKYRNLILAILVKYARTRREGTA